MLVLCHRFFEQLADGSIGQVHWPAGMPLQARLLRHGFLGLLQVKLPSERDTHAAMATHSREGTAQAVAYTHRELDDSGVAATR